MADETRLSPAERQALDEAVGDIVGFTNRNMRNITQTFLDLPLPSESFPEYWSESSPVRYPRSLNMIRQVLHEGGYSDPVQVFGDLKLVFLNGIQWLSKSTEAMRDAKSMETGVEDVWLRHAPPLPTLEQMGIGSAYDDDTATVMGEKKSKSRMSEKQAAEVERFGKQTERLMAGLVEQYKSGLQTTWVPNGPPADPSMSTVPLPALGGLEDEGAATPLDASLLGPDQAAQTPTLSNLDILASTSSTNEGEPRSFTHPTGKQNKRPASNDPELDPGLSTSDKSQKLEEDASKTQKLDTVQVRSQTLSIGDWIHLKSQNDFNKTGIAQILQISKDGTQNTFLHVQEYLRPEDTVHSITKTFYENEVLQTATKTRYPLDAFESRCFVQQPHQDLNGAPAHDCSTASYVCEAFYDSKTKKFTPINDWFATQPTQAHYKSSASGHPSKGNLPALRKLKSPFLRGIRGSGFIDAQIEDHTAPLPKTASSIKWAAVGDGSDLQQATQQVHELAARDQFDTLPESLASHFRSDPATGELLWFQSPPVQIPVQEPPLHSFDYLLWRAQQGLPLSTP